MPQGTLLRVEALISVKTNKTKNDWVALKFISENEINQNLKKKKIENRKNKNLERFFFLLTSQRRWHKKSSQQKLQKAVTKLLEFFGHFQKTTFQWKSFFVGPSTKKCLTIWFSQGRAGLTYRVVPGTV